MTYQTLKTLNPSRTDLLMVVCDYLQQWKRGNFEPAALMMLIALLMIIRAIIFLPKKLKKFESKKIFDKFWHLKHFWPKLELKNQNFHKSSPLKRLNKQNCDQFWPLKYPNFGQKVNKSPNYYILWYSLSALVIIINQLANQMGLIRTEVVKMEWWGLEISVIGPVAGLYK